MSNITDSVTKFHYYATQYWLDEQDPRSGNYFFVNITPWPLAMVMLIYFVLVTKLIPNYMKNRKPFGLKKLMLTYNVWMIAINFYAFIYVASRINYGRVFWNFEYPSRDWHVDITAGYLYWITKFIDWIDTFFMALRKKDSHISFLHLYHHISVPMWGWLALKLNVGVPAIGLFALMNSLVHTIMYAYYALSSFGPKIQKYLWWKRYITIIQLIQFLIFTVYGFILYFKQTGYPTELMYIALAQPPFFFYMFYDFYKKSYKEKSN